MLLSRGEDKQWRRLGAKKRFDNTRVEPPKDWDLEDVELRMAQLGRQIAEIELTLERQRQMRSTLEDLTEKDFTELSVELVEVEQLLNARCRRAGIQPDDIDEATRKQFHQAAEDIRAHSDLSAQRTERARLVSEAAELADSVWRSLNQHDATPAGSSTQSDHLREGIAHLKATKLG